MLTVRAITARQILTAPITINVPDIYGNFIIDAWMKKQFTVITSPQLLSEIHEVLMRPAILGLLKKTPDEVNEFIKLLIQKTFLTEGKLEFVAVLNNS